MESIVQQEKPGLVGMESIVDHEKRRIRGLEPIADQERPHVAGVEPIVASERPRVAGAEPSARHENTRIELHDPAVERDRPFVGPLRWRVGSPDSLSGLEDERTERGDSRLRRRLDRPGVLDARVDRAYEPADVPDSRLGARTVVAELREGVDHAESTRATSRSSGSSTVIGFADLELRLLEAVRASPLRRLEELGAEHVTAGGVRAWWAGDHRRLVARGVSR
jgi:hypothetical protein